jgi:uncharacterized 2Fe-2S/4Fe-4S cluster protein (DUF4445 family)
MTGFSTDRAGENKARGWVRAVTPARASLTDNRGYDSRVLAPLAKEFGGPLAPLSPALAARLPEIVQGGGGPLLCAVFQDGPASALVDAAPLSAGETFLGLAVDLGTTRVILRLLDLATCAVLGESGFDNPQCAVAPDVLARAHHAERPGGLEELRGLIAAGLNANARALARQHGFSPKQIVLAAVAGNTAMTHLFLGLPCNTLIREPYLPVMNRPGTLRAPDLGLAFSPRARVYVFPNIGSYFGGDLIAGILATGLHTGERPRMLVDVGTNAEVAVGCGDWLMACAGAAGPALEGGIGRMGMTAGPGAVERIRIDPATGEQDIRVIGGGRPAGICGSGVIDLAAELFLNGMLDQRGKFAPEACGGRLLEKDGMRELVLFTGKETSHGRDIAISQAELDSLTRSKAAMYSILRTITMAVGVGFEDLAAFYVAGTFGSYIDPASAIAIGMLPDLPLETYQARGNTSLEGAALALTDASAIQEAERIRERITYMELNVNQEFMLRFSAAKFYPHTDPSRFPTVERRALERRGARAGRKNTKMNAGRA